MTSAAEVNLAAEVRAVEEGHRTRFSPDGRHLLVVSDTRPGVTYRVRAVAFSTGVLFGCSCPWGVANDGQGELGVTGCKHQALAARRLEREGLARFDGARWVATERAWDILCPPCREPGCGARSVLHSDRCPTHDDPFADLDTF